MKITLRELVFKDYKERTLDPILDACGVSHHGYNEIHKWKRDLDRLWERRIQVTYIAEHEGQAVGFITCFREIVGYSGEYALYITDIRVKPEYRGGKDYVTRALINCVTRHAIADFVEEVHAIVSPEYEPVFREMLYGEPTHSVLCRKIPWGQVVREPRRTYAEMQVATTRPNP